MSFNLKLMTSVIVSTLLLLTIAVGTSYVISLDAIGFLGRSTIRNQISSLVETLKMQNDITQEKLESDLGLMGREIDARGGFQLSANATVATRMVNQISKEEDSDEIPALMLGSEIINNNFSLVDSVQSMVGGTSTIFQVLPGRLLRVSTNVKKLDGKRAVGTYIPDSSPVYKTVMSGKTFRGKAYVVNDWYLTAYKPMKDAAGNIVAVIYVGRKILTPQLNQLLDKISYHDFGSVFAALTKGSFIFRKDELGEPAKETMKALLSARDGFVEYRQGGVTRLAYVSYYEPWDWHIGLSLDESVIDLGTDKTMLFAGIAITVAGILLSAIFFVFLIRRLLRPLQELSGVTAQIAAGNLDARARYDADDAIGETVRSVNTMVGNLEEKIQAADRSEAAALAESARAQEAMKAAEQGKQRVESLLEAITHVAEQALGIATDLASNAEQLSSQARDIKGGSETQKMRIQETATAMIQMNATVLEVAQNAAAAAEGTEQAKEKAEEGSAVVANVVSSISEVSEKAEAMQATMNDLGHKAESIGGILSVITDIADQTNLLALNAAIEAARAGDAGRGFAVVADEVRKLAEKTMQATKEVGDAISGIQAGSRVNLEAMEASSASVARSTELAREAGQVLNEIVSIVDSAADQVRSIATASEEQSSTSDEISRSTEEIQTISHQASEGISQSVDAIGDIVELSGKLQEIMSDLQQRTQEEKA
ncbi:methyl-accepting chemotaxis protein [Pseudodesulfovibrio sp.]|uniref:methyl-accepting chemotaxis protein n=1 Tax=unclassified Pseudodesulfovibrio TaxID=2661612 RepID=UPI003AFF7592